MMRALIALPISLIFFAQSPVMAEDTGYQPDIAVLDGQTSLAFPIEGQLSMLDGGTIEFWVAPSWAETPAYDPVILSNSGRYEAVYSIAMQADKKALIVTSAGEAGSFTFDFDDSAIHHVAIVNLDDRVVVMIDGNIAGVSGLNFANLKPETLSIGSAKDGYFPFNGVIGGLRIWSTAIEPETLIEYNWEDVRQDTSDHPYLPFLSGYSEFETQDFVIIDKPVVPTWSVSEDDPK